jgi:asparagine synthase (glutamine-hydrolysing)
MTPADIVCGYPLGNLGQLAPPSDGGRTTPRAVLETLVRRALLTPPCAIAFSGGRDSSTVLAVATHVARREGLPDPVPISRAFPGVVAAEEDHWQELVVRHLGLREWHRIQLGDELDLVGPLATALVSEHGVLWPPTMQGDVPILDLVGGGSLLDGEGGDEVFGVSSHRVAPVNRLIREPWRRRRRRVRPVIAALAPYRVRIRYDRRQYDRWPFAWLRPAAREAVVATMAAFRARQPLRFAHSVREVPQRKAQAMHLHNRKILATRRGVRFDSPLLHPDFVHALARDGGWLGLGDRTAVLRALVSDLLPAAVIERRSKAEFGSTFMHRHTREFASSWTGAGVDPTLVDPDELRRMWVEGNRNALTSGLLQAAWLGDHSPCSDGTS